MQISHSAGLGGALDAAFLTGSLVILLLLVQRDQGSEGNRNLKQWVSKPFRSHIQSVKKQNKQEN